MPKSTFAFLILFLLVALVSIAAASDAITTTAPTNALLLHGTPDPNATPDFDGESAVTDPTYFRDVEPIILANCASCHQEGGIGYSYFDAYDTDFIQEPGVSDDIAWYAETRYMPPWPPSDESLPFQHERTLTDDEIALIVHWAEHGAPMGDPSERAEATDAASIPQIRHDVVMTMSEPYVPTGEILDDYRCFMLDPGFTQDTYVTGSDFLPGNGEIAHHALFFVVDEATIPEAMEKSNEDDRPGWECFGGPGLKGNQQDLSRIATPMETLAALSNQDVDVAAVLQGIEDFQDVEAELEAAGESTGNLSLTRDLVSLGVDVRQLLLDLNIPIEEAMSAGMGGSLGGWAPGSVAVTSPEGTGILIPAGGQIVVQMHYNLYRTIGSDQSTLVLEVAPLDADITPLEAPSLLAPVEIPCPDGADAAECDREVARMEVQNPQTANSLLAVCGQTLETYADNTADNAYGACDYPITFEGWLVSVGPHMHELGKATRITLNPDTPDEIILIDIPEWDFHWQGQYSFVEPVELAEGDVLRMECWWDNSEGTRYVVWGEGTQDEMCFNFTRFLKED